MIMSEIIISDSPANLSTPQVEMCEESPLNSTALVHEYNDKKLTESVTNLSYNASNIS